MTGSRAPLRKGAFAASALALAAVAACSTTRGPAPRGEAGAPAETRPLLREEAARRAKQIRGAAYQLWFALDGEHEDFQGRATIRFERLPDADGDLHLDFHGGAIESLAINDEPLARDEIARRYDDLRITLPEARLRAGANRVEVAYRHPYSRTGSGLHRYRDPADGRFYLYTDLEPYDANQVFPCFDQPDLKASYELAVEAPAAWTVIANTAEKEVERQGERKVWTFPPSPAFSTYLFALHAGEYRAWSADAAGIPLRLFARHSLAKYVEPAEWFETTRRGLAFFGTRFGYPYPYAKYDQVIVPEFNGGAMENVAAVTFSERFVFRSRVTEDRRRDRGDVILHEMAHMWFGNLVTMRWWNGLWLNESFASFAAAWALDEATRFGGETEGGQPGGPVWQGFFSDMKAWAYDEDQRVTTHPIEVPVPDTDQAFANFDAITYGKGAAVLKQLRFLVGEDEFREALHRYFYRYALRNTTTADFVQRMAEAAGRELGRWQRQWLRTPGLNGVETAWECAPHPKSGKPQLTRLTLRQRGAPLRTHRTRVALYRAGRDGAALLPEETFDVEYSAASTEVRAAERAPCPDFVFANHDDFDYVRLELNERDLAFLDLNLGRVADGLTRQLLWHTLAERMGLGELAPARFAELAFRHLERESNPRVVSGVLGALLDPHEGANTAYRLLPPARRPAFASRFREFARRALAKAVPGGDLQLLWFQAWTSSPLDESGLKLAESWLAGRELPRGLALDAARRWELIRALARHGHPSAREAIRKEAARDGTDYGAREALRAEAALPEAAVKRAWFDRFVAAAPAPGVDEPKLSESDLAEAMRDFRLIGQQAARQELATEFWLALPKVAALRGDRFAARFAGATMPLACEAEALATARAFVTGAGAGLPPRTRRALRVAIQEDERCLRSREAGLGAADGS